MPNLPLKKGSETHLIDGYTVLSASPRPTNGWTQAVVRMLSENYEQQGDTQQAAHWRERLLPTDEPD